MLEAARDESGRGTIPDAVQYFVPGTFGAWEQDGRVHIPRSQVRDAASVVPLLLRDDGWFQAWINLSPVGVLGDSTVLQIDVPGRWTDRVIVGELAFPHEPFHLLGPSIPPGLDHGDPVPRGLPEVAVQDRSPSLSPSDVEAFTALPTDERPARLRAFASRLAAGGSDDPVAAQMIALADAEEAPEMMDSWLVYMGMSKADGFLDTLRQWLEAADPDVRSKVLFTIVTIDSPRVNAILLRVIESEEDPRLRRYAVRSLVRRGSLGEWEPSDLSALTRDDDWRPPTKREYLRLLGR